MPSENANIPEIELLSQVAGGDEKAFADLVDRYWNKIYTVALSFLKSTDLSKDIVQEVFLKVWIKRASLPEIQKFDSWIFIIARNEILNTMQKKGARYPVGEWLSGLPEREEESPEKVLSFKELRGRIHDGILLLPPQQRLVFTLSRIDGLSHDEICGQLGIAKSTVKNTLVKALNFLRNYLDAQDSSLIIAALIIAAYTGRQ